MLYKSNQRPPPHYTLTLYCAAVLFAHAAFAAKPPPPPPPLPPSSGTLVLDYAGPDVSGAVNWGLVVAPSGSLYAVGNDYPADGYWKQLVLASGNSGSTWSLLDEFRPPGTFVDFWFGMGGGITSDSTGNLYVSSFTYDYASTDRTGWYVRRSTDGGLTWTTVADFAVGPVSSGSDDVAVARDGSGNVYVAACDIYSSGSGFSHLWTVRKGVGGVSFSTVDTLPDFASEDARSTAAFASSRRAAAASIDVWISAMRASS